MADSWLERRLFMIFLHSEISGLHLAEADTGQGVPQPLAVERCNGCHNGEAEALAGAEVEEYGCPQQADAE